MKYNLKQINRFANSRGITDYIFSYDVIWEDDYTSNKKSPKKIVFYKENWTPYKNIRGVEVVPSYPRRDRIFQEFDLQEFVLFISRGPKLRKILSS